jgi:chaperone modulatory protein CbpM
MTISRQEFLLRLRLDQETLTTWIEEEWLMPRSAAAEPEFSDADVARAELIRDLREDLGVNDSGIGVILSLIDQVHGLRKTLAEVLDGIRARPDGLLAKPLDEQE